MRIYVDKTRDEMGKRAAYDVYAKIAELLETNDEVNIVFAAAPSQNEFLSELANYKDIEWHRVNAFHLDEYIGLDNDAPQKFGNFLKERIFSKLPFKNVYYIGGNGNIDNIITRYSKLLEEHRLDIACIGIGENGHIAFNDPGVADFNDTKILKKVKLDNICRMQQVHDKCFDKFDDVPEYALTLTIPAIMAAKYIYCIVPGTAKARAVAGAVNGPISEKCPASVLRRHKSSYLYLDKDSSKYLNFDDIKCYS